jgi:hypothetical protein
MPETTLDQATQESNAGAETVETVSTETAASEETQGAQPEAQTAGETAKEQEFEIDGEKFTASQIRAFKKDYANDSSWKDKNRRESEDLNKRKERVARLELIAPILEQRPEVLQQLFAPKQERNLQAELSALSAQRPDPYTDFPAYEAWQERKQDLKNAIKEEEVLGRAKHEYMRGLAEQHNLSIEKDARERYVNAEKVSEEDFQNKLTPWIVRTLKPDADGRYPAESYDLAYRMLYGDREVRTGKLEAAQRTVQQIDKAKPADTAPGARRAETQKTERELEDEAFVEEAKRFAPKKK